ncbi:MAG: DUF2834 domain-containing protein [Candidatus Manganitrophaceae bacterium]
MVTAVIGTILPYYYIGSFAIENNFNVLLFIEQIFSARASLGFVIDLFISSFAFWPFLLKEAKRLKTPAPGLFLFLNLTIGLSCALPFFLYFREKNEPFSDNGA